MTGIALGRRSRGGKPALTDEQVARVRSAIEELLMREEYQYRGRPNIAALARDLGRSNPTVWAIVEGQQRPSFQTAERVAQLLEVDPWELVQGEKKGTPPPALKEHPDWKESIREAKKRYRFVNRSLWGQVGELKMSPVPAKLTPEMLQELARIVALSN